MSAVGAVLRPGQVPGFVWPLDRVDPVIAFIAYGCPAPQGSKRLAVRGGRMAMVEASDRLKPWRDGVREVSRLAIRQWAIEHGTPWRALDCPVVLQTTFTMPPPARLARARVFHTGVPDTDKLNRAVGDALSPRPVAPGDTRGMPDKAAKRARREIMDRRRAACVLHDDSRVCAWDTKKVYPATTVDSLARPGVVVRVWRAEDLLRAQ